MMIKFFLSIILFISTIVIAAPLQIILPYAPGGGTEVTARRFQKFLSEKKNIESIIMYKPGAEGIVGTIDISKSPADGSVIGITATMAVIETQAKGNDVELISMLEIPTLLLVSSVDSKIKNFQDLKKQNNINFGVGSDPQKKSIEQLITLLNKQNSITVTYKGGGPVLNDLLGGHIDVAFLPAPIVLPLIESKHLTLLASTATLNKKYKNWINYAGYCLILPKDSTDTNKKFWTLVVKEYLNDNDVHKDIISNLGTVPPSGNEFLKQSIKNMVRWQSGPMRGTANP